MIKKLFVVGVLGLSFNIAFAQLYTSAGTVGATVSSVDVKNVGIGTNGPTAPLDIQSKILVNPASPVYGVGIKAYNSSAWSRGYNFLNPDGTSILAGFGALGPIDGLQFLYIGKAHNDNVIRLYPDNKKSVFYGNVGIGSDDPQAKLDINFGGEPKTIKFMEAANGSSTMNSMMRFTWYNDTADLGIVRSGSYPIEAMAIRFNQKEVARFTPNGNASLQGKLEAKEVKVTLTPTADFVFEENYDLPKLEEVEKHIKDKKHLPEIASAKEMEKEGVNVGEFQIKLLQKIEELTLYVIEQDKKLKTQAEEIQNLKNQLESKQ
ncbi:hypothetical protein [Chryseobacterium sp.]|uniref:hypothetical protein n=1 Tax=Chryseobacterium sp. TaxID=1871047 RepID=UPI0025C21E0C|nr:hypothetical protein [Chryseobacterium sp.]